MMQKSKPAEYMQCNRSHTSFMNVGRVGLQTEGKRVGRKRYKGSNTKRSKAGKTLELESMNLQGLLPV